MQRIRLRRAFRKFLAFCVITYGASLLFLLFFETWLVYPGLSSQQHHYPSLELKTLTNGNHTLHYWQGPSSADDTPLILYLHGNGGLVPATSEYFAKQGITLYALEYPGYEGLPGTPEESLLIQQAQTLYTKIQQDHPHRPIAIWGYSLGTGIAVQAAQAHAPCTMVLEAPFTAAVDVAAELYPIFPVRLLMHNSYRSRDFIAQLHSPLFIMHGTADDIVPYPHGQKLFALANQPKTLKTYEGYGHFNLRQAGAYEDALGFLQTHCRPHP